MGKDDVRPIRSILFVGGDDGEQLRASTGFGADAVICDLEEPRGEPFSDDQRLAAGADVGEFLRTLPGSDVRTQYFVRVRGPHTGLMFHDLAPVVCDGLTGVLDPEDRRPRRRHRRRRRATAAEVENGVEPGTVVLYPILETPMALRLAYEIAMASPRVAYMGGAVSRFGDIHQAVGYRWTPEGRETLFLRSKVLLDAKAAGIRYPISGMWGGASDDLAGFARFATELRELGYYGMMLGNPRPHPARPRDLHARPPRRSPTGATSSASATRGARTGKGPILYGDPNQGEGHVVHGAHVGRPA